MDTHRRYSDCMQHLYTFKEQAEQYGYSYAAKFVEGKTNRTQEFREINTCRSVTRDYWKQVYVLVGVKEHELDTPVPVYSL